MLGISAGLFLDLRVGDSDSFLYLGSRSGYVAPDSNSFFLEDHDEHWDAADWTRTTSFESGIILKNWRPEVGATLAYKFIHIGDLDYETSLGNNVNFPLGNFHGFKVGVIFYLNPKK